MQDRKSLDCSEEMVARNMDTEGDSSKGSKEVKSIVEKAIIPENKHIVMNRTLVEIGILKVLLVKSQKEMRNTSLETRRQVIFVVIYYYEVVENLAELCSTVG